MMSKMKYSAIQMSTANLSKVGKLPAKPRKQRSDKHKKQLLGVSGYHQLSMRSLDIPYHQPILPRASFTRSSMVQACQNTSVAGPRTQRDAFVSKKNAYLMTFNNQFVTFAEEGGAFGIYVEEKGKNEEHEMEDKVVICYYKSDISAGAPGSKKFLVSLHLLRDDNCILHADCREFSVNVRKFQKTTQLLPEQTLFVLDQKSSEYCSFECKSNPGTYIGAINNRLQLMSAKDPSSCSNIMFKLS
ncbi:interleukin-33 isoform X2 [Echinops telfairi]|uniref:Interleukin-33 isoform X2 n=1 Tax=Echinops telfairi TaxID=9371 RepID=A0AC55D062_ECHTE|nr:interleukin-33 isoform X2 [Echinops telfairi]